MPLDRSEVKSELNLGVVDQSASELDFPTYSEKTPRFKKLDLFDKYYHSTQYDDKQPWSRSRNDDGTYVPIKDRKPSVIYNIPKLLIERAASKLCGQRAFPKVTIPEDPLTEELVGLLMKASKFKTKAMDFGTHMLKSGAVFVKFAYINGTPKVDVYNPKHCFPIFNESTDQLDAIRIQYKFKDQNAQAKFKKDVWKWFRLDITKNQEVIYDSPEIKQGAESSDPEFEIVEVIDHNLGFVPGEWIVNGEVSGSIDGEAIIEDILPISDAINYQLSQSDQAIMYTQDPQLVFKGMSSEETDDFIRSSTKAWNLGREGEAAFLEIGGSGLEIGKDHEKRLNQKAQDLAKVVILDPERMAGVAQSGRAMEIMHGPFVDLVHEIRPWLGDYGIVPFLQKMVAAAIILVERGESIAIQFPEGYAPVSLEIELIWKPVFEPTLEDIQKVISLAVQASNANLISRKTATTFIQEYFGVVDAEQEQADVIAQPLPPSPFGPFGGF